MAWNGPEDFQPQATEIIDEVLEEYFKHIKTGMRFFVRSRSKLKLMSTTIRSYITKRSRIILSQN